MAAPSSASSSKLLEHINHAADNDASFENIEEEERVQLLTACEKLKRKLQTPRDALFDILLGVGRFSINSLMSIYRWVETKL